MGMAIEHARTSAKIHGGKPEDYIALHEFIDSSGEAHPNTQHRVVLHTSFAVKSIIPKVFGHEIKNSKGKMISTVRLAEEHVREDFGGKVAGNDKDGYGIDGGFIPSLQDFLQAMKFEPWMDNGKKGAVPPSWQAVEKASPGVVPQWDDEPELPRRHPTATRGGERPFRPRRCTGLD